VNRPIFRFRRGTHEPSAPTFPRVAFSRAVATSQVGRSPTSAQSPSVQTISVAKSPERPGSISSPSSSKGVRPSATRKGRVAILLMLPMLPIFTDRVSGRAGSRRSGRGGFWRRGDLGGRCPWGGVFEGPAVGRIVRSRPKRRASRMAQSGSPKGRAARPIPNGCQMARLDFVRNIANNRDNGGRAIDDADGGVGSIRG
jgi:hypothetical protein